MGFLRKFLKSDRGSSVVEFALALPIMVIFLWGTFEVATYALLHNKLTRIASTMSDIVGRQNLTRERLAAIMNTAEIIARPFDFNNFGGLIMTQVRNDGETDDPANMVVSWQEVQGAVVSRVGTPGAFPDEMPDDVEVIENQTLLVTEVFYNYTPLIFGSVLPNKVIYKTASFVPRIGTMNTLLGE